MPSQPPSASLSPRAAQRGEPCIVEVAERLFGGEIAEIVASRLAGQRFYVPRKITAENELARLIGLDKAAMIAAEIGGLAVEVRGIVRLRRRRIVRLHKAANSVTEIARKVGCTERRVYQILALPRAAGELPPARIRVSRR